MLYCGLAEVVPGMRVAASVFHPRRTEVELLAPGVVLDAALLPRLRSLGVAGVWVEHSLTDDLDGLINATPSPILRTACQQLKHDFDRIAGKTVTAGQIQVYRQIVLELVCELIANRKVSGLTERLAHGGAAVVTHAANVAYLAISVGLELESYVVRARKRMAVEHARDMTALGIGAMLHDIGKINLPPDQQALTALTAEGPSAGEAEVWSTHPRKGYDMLGLARVPASARQVVLNHHQRWDGSGFPDLAAVTRDRRQGPQQGEEIHVFCRIVSAADVLDHLLATESDEHRPVVAALHAFQSSRFDGWFDPVVRDAVLRKVAPFPVGSRVMLNDGRAAAVIAPSLAQPCRPAVRVLSANENSPPVVVDLMLDRSLHITTCGGDPVEDYLFELPSQRSLALNAMLQGAC